MVYMTDEQDLKDIHTHTHTSLIILYLFGYEVPCCAISFGIVGENRECSSVNEKFFLLYHLSV